MMAKTVVILLCFALSIYLVGADEGCPFRPSNCLTHCKEVKGCERGSCHGFLWTSCSCIGCEKGNGTESMISQIEKEEGKRPPSAPLFK